MSLTPLTPEGMRDAGLRAVRMAEQKRDKAKRREKELVAKARRHLQLAAHSKMSWWQQLRTRVEDVAVDERLVLVVADVWAGSDPQWKGAVSDNRWYLDQATAYGANK